MRRRRAGRLALGAAALLAVPQAARAHHPGPGGHGAWVLLVFWLIAAVVVALWVLDVWGERRRVSQSDSRQPPTETP